MVLIVFFAVEFEFLVMLVKGGAICYNGFDKNVVFIWTHRPQTAPNLHGLVPAVWSNGWELLWWNNLSIVVLDLCFDMS